MRRILSATVVAATAAVLLGLAPAAHAVCGGGEPGEPCYCPDLKVITVYC